MPNLDDLVELDIEYGNSTAFFSASKQREGSNYYSCEKNCLKATFYGDLERTKLHVKDVKDVKDINVGKLKRVLEFSSVEASYLFDMVSRFIIYSDNNGAASIAGRSYPHKSSNLYYQFEDTGTVEVPISKTQKLTFKTGRSKVPTGFKEVFYIRDEAKTERGYRWIVHHRLIVDPTTCELVLRCCNPRFEGALPFQQFIPKWFKRIFFRIRETRYPNFPFMSVGESILQRNDSAVIETMVELHGR